MSHSSKSNHSNRSKGNRVISTKKSEVDEGLFGSKDPRGQGGSMLTAVLSKEEVKTLRANMLKGKQADAILIKESELQRIKDSTKIVGKQQEAELKKRMEEEKERECEASEQLKIKMKLFDQTRAKKLPLSEYQKEQVAKNQALLKNAERVLEENMDDVKNMNKMVHYAKCVTIRDRQLEEAKEVVKAKKEEEQKMDIIMEVARLKELKYHEEHEKVQKETRRQGALVIIDQIKDRQNERERQQEIKNEEQKEMLKQIRKLQEEEIELQEKKILKGKQLLEIVQEANRAAIDIKQKKTLEEKEADSKIVEYNKKKAEREEAYQAELKRIHDEKEMEVQKLREKQQKAMNKQSEIDELKAKRAFEENERIARAKERQECEDRARRMKELQEARQMQELDKERSMAEQVKQERDEFLRIIKQQKLEQEAERRQEEERKKVFYEHARDLRMQIAKNEEQNYQSKKDYLLEGEILKGQQAKEKETLERIKREKLEELDRLGIPDKYRAELMLKKVT